MNNVLEIVIVIVIPFEIVFGLVLTLLPYTYLISDSNRKINYIKFLFIPFYYGVCESAKESLIRYNKNDAWNLNLFGKIFLIVADILLLPMRLISSILFLIIVAVSKLCTKSFIDEQTMKKYILNEVNMVLVRKTHRDLDRHLFYMVDDNRVCVKINLNEDYYDFWCADKKWNGPDGDNKFHEKDMYLKYRKAETNSWLRMHWWLIKYYNKNIGRWKKIYKHSVKRIKH